MKKRTKQLFLLSAFLVFSFFIFFQSKNPTTMHFIHLMTPPDDLYNPVVKDEFKFWEKGYKKEYLLDFEYTDYYSFGFKDSMEKIPSGWNCSESESSCDKKYEFDGKLKVSFYGSDSDLIEEFIIDEIRGGTLFGEDMEYYKEISLRGFEVPLKGKYKKNIVMVVEVLEPDEKLKEFEDSLQLFVAVSSSP